MIAKVAIKKINLKSDKLYSYLVPEELRKSVEVGKRVVIPFGKNNKKRQGLIFELSQEETLSNIKSIYAVLDDVLHISNEFLDLIKWIKENYFCSFYDAVRLVLPESLKGNFKDIKYTFDPEILNETLENEEKEFLVKISNLKHSYFYLKDLEKLCINNKSAILENLLSKGLLSEKLTVSNTRQKKIDKLLSLSPNKKIDKLKLSKKQKEVYDFLSVHNEKITLKNLQDATKVSNAIIKALIKKGVIFESDKISNDEIICDFSSDRISYEPTILSRDQKCILESIINLYEEKKHCVSLIHGVTGSGKTQILLKLIDYVINLNKSAIFLVPEIALTTQFTEIFKSKYKEKVALIHSKISDSERSETWNKAKNGEVKVILGARSAVFAPLVNLGLIIIDEEHESAYKSENSPRIDAREVAKYRCKYNNCMLILSSATPSLESYYNALKGKYYLYTLKNRYSGSKLPKVEIVDMNSEIGFKLGFPFSNKLVKLLREVILRKEQSIILVNRRGYNTFVKCKDCGEVQRCPYCSVSLIYHKVSGELICHYCGYLRNFSDNCEICGKGKLLYLGFGTQKVESQLSEFLPEARILRMDSDLVSTRKFSREKALKSFENGEYDILIGTQMVSKGFNFSKVTLVGILMADQSLYESDFRSYEKTFSLVTQTVGRAGRGNIPGNAIIQTFTPESHVLRLAAAQNYEEFFRNEIKLRKLMLNPPFVDICVIILTGKNEEKVWEASTKLFESLKLIARDKYNDLPLRILPPASALIKKISNKYRYKIVIKCRNNKRFRDMIRELIYNFKISGVISVSVDINPTTIL